jgi:hypothetical protein
LAFFITFFRSFPEVKQVVSSAKSNESISVQLGKSLINHGIVWVPVYFLVGSKWLCTLYQEGAPQSQLFDFCHLDNF